MVLQLSAARRNRFKRVNNLGYETHELHFIQMKFCVINPNASIKNIFLYYIYDKDKIVLNVKLNY